MKKITGSVLVLAGLLLPTLATSAGAVTTVQPVVKPLTVKLGVFFPSNGNDSNSAGSTQFSAGLDYAITKQNQSDQTNTALPSIYLDYQGGSRNGGHEYTTGLGVAIRSQSTDGSGGNPYIGVGIGAYDETTKKNGHSSSDNSVNFGGKIFGGYELKSGFLIEANYQLLGSEKGINPSGLGVQVGYRF